MKEEADLFLNYLRNEKRYSEHTITGYRTDLEQFSEFCLSEFEIDESELVSRNLIRSWVVSLMDKEYDPRSIRRKISSLKSYYKFLKKTGRVKKDPTEQIQTPKTKKRLPSYLDEKSMEMLFDRLNFPADVTGMRDKLMLVLFYETGMRLSELIGLKTGDLDKRKRELKIFGKRNKERIVPVSEEVIELTEEYIKARTKLGDTEDHLLVTDKGKKLYPKFVYRKINNYLSAVTSIDKKSPHVLRHTFATHMLNNGAELNSIKELLGHSSLAATQVYTHNSIEKLKEIYKNTHPKG